MRKAKTDLDLYAQEIRLYRLLRETTTQKLKRIDPATSGSFSLATHWGNEPALQLVERYWFIHGNIAQAIERRYSQLTFIQSK